ncbi:zinc finger protein OZF-like [Galleria mellonella]|uniref:Zinc finger protein OZF-like n=1 Tax=Galleria mellonella TaxID=7137 RepID=A0A6J1WZB9_GALME|nr:zinc finger protein OZF-like [Galleria mellonella]
MVDDIRKCCRICLDSESDHVPVLGDPTIYLHIRSCLDITISQNDELPKVICRRCVSQLSDFYNFQLNARCSQDWLETSIQEKSKKPAEKTQLQPLPDSEYNSDSLLEFLNNTANIEEYLNNLGKEDIPSIVNLLDRNVNELDVPNKSCSGKQKKMPTPKKKETKSNCVKMEIDVLDSDMEIVKEILMKETEPKCKMKSTDKNQFVCFGCKIKFDNVHKLSQHVSVCDTATRTCIHCNLLFDSKQKMFQHSIVHNATHTCNCGKEFSSKEKLLLHHKTCLIDYGAFMGCVYRCKQCGQTYNERFQLYKHVKEHIVKSDERICDICGHKFIGTEALSKHKKETHNTGDLYRCKVCKLTSADRKEIYLHVQKHTAIPEPRRHLCESCGRSFATRVTLARHSLQHEKLKDSACRVCGKTFSNIKSKDQHTCEHVNLVMCDRCGQNVDSFKLNMHKCV